MRFKIDDMTCNHCVMVITKAIHGIDPHANVQANIAARTVEIDGDVNAASAQFAMHVAGYTAIQLDDEAAVSQSADAQQARETAK